MRRVGDRDRDRLGVFVYFHWVCTVYRFGLFIQGYRIGMIQGYCIGMIGKASTVLLVGLFGSRDDSITPPLKSLLYHTPTPRTNTPAAYKPIITHPSHNPSYSQLPALIPAPLTPLILLLTPSPTLWFRNASPIPSKLLPLVSGIHSPHTANVTRLAPPKRK